jgi:hypothetical protein
VACLAVAVLGWASADRGMWTIHRGGGHAGASDGFCATLDEAKAKLAETWRAWLALNRDTAAAARGGAGRYQSGTRLPPAPPLFAVRSLELDRICALSSGPADAATAVKATAAITSASDSVILLNMVILLRAICSDGRFLGSRYYRGETEFRVTRSDEIVRGGVFFRHERPSDAIWPLPLRRSPPRRGAPGWLFMQDNLSPQKWRRVHFSWVAGRQGADDGAASQCGDSHD